MDIIDFLPDATFVTDRQGRVMAWNRAIEEMTGVGKARMLGQGERACTVPFYGERRAHLIDLLDLDDRELEEKYRHVQRKGKTLNAEAFTPLLHGGKGAYVWATAAPLFNCQGERTGAIEAIRDITAHKEAEATIIEYRDHLEEVVAQRTRELLAAKEAAETANRAKSQLLANLSHELRTPLNAIIGFSELTLQSGPGAGTHDHLSKINCAGKSLLAMINDLLDFAGSEEGMLELERTPFGLDQVLAREIANAQRQAQEKGLLTSGTYGRTSTGSSSSAAPTLSSSSTTRTSLFWISGMATNESSRRSRMLNGYVFSLSRLASPPRLFTPPHSGPWWLHSLRISHRRNRLYHARAPAARAAAAAAAACRGAFSRKR